MKMIFIRDTVLDERIIKAIEHKMRLGKLFLNQETNT